MSGTTFAIMKNIGYWAPLGTAIPGRDIGYGGTWPAGWVKVNDTVNGWQIVSRNPRVAVPSEERGRIGQVSGGDEGLSVAVQFRTPNIDLMAKIAAWSKKSKAAAAATTTTPAYPAVDIYALDKDLPMGMMLGVEGIATAGSFFTGRRWVRFIAYNAENTGNPEFPFRSSGLDAVISPSAAFECLALPSAYPSSMLTGTDYTAADLDDDRRANFFFIDAPTV